MAARIVDRGREHSSPLSVAWHTVNDAVVAAGRKLVIADPPRLHGVEVIGVDEHCWRHPRGNQARDVERFVTVIINLTPVRDGTGPARPLDLIEGRSRAVCRARLDRKTPAFRAGLQVVAMDGFTGFKSATAATAEALPDVMAVMDPFHVIALAGDALSPCRQRVGLLQVWLTPTPRTEFTSGSVEDAASIRRSSPILASRAPRVQPA